MYIISSYTINTGKNVLYTICTNYTLSNQLQMIRSYYFNNLPYHTDTKRMCNAAHEHHWTNEIWTTNRPMLFN